MSAFFNYFYDFISAVGSNIWQILAGLGSGIVKLFNIPYYTRILNSYRKDFGVLGWVLFGVATIIILVILAVIIYFLIRLIKRNIRFKQPIKENEQLKDEIVKLKHEMYKLSYEKDKILAMQVSKLGYKVNDDLLNEDGIEDGENGENVENSTTDNNEPRFTKLMNVDKFYKSGEYVKPEYDDDITLEEVCKRFRNFAASRLGLYYDLDLIKAFIAALGATKMIVLQGISGTGKTSLAYAFGQFINRPTVMCAVQPAWRDRTELFGYFNEFTKRFNETEFLKAVYEASYYEDMQVVVLDEMNIARVEYYFAEMLSVLEMPRPEERNIAIVSAGWDSDPEHLNDGVLNISPNVWYIGTINNDDSTFAVADKVYDRAIPIDLDSKANRFDAPDTEPVYLRYEHMNKMFQEAMDNYAISEESKAKLEEVDNYVIQHFRITFGNRILKQIYAFVPCYVACGGSEVDGIDFILSKKIIRKFSSLNIGYLKDEIDGFILYLNEVFGDENMNVCKADLLQLKKMG